MPVFPAPGHHFESFGILSNTAYPMAPNPRSGVVVRMDLFSFSLIYHGLYGFLQFFRTGQIIFLYGLQIFV